jgi:hypothetical protein
MARRVLGAGRAVLLEACIRVLEVASASLMAEGAMMVCCVMEFG